MKTRLIFSIILYFVAFSSCNKETEKPKLKVGMFVNGIGYDDKGYKQNCKDGLMMALENYQFDTLFTSATENIQDELDYFPEHNFDVLFLAGVINENELVSTAERYPKAKYVLIDGAYEGELENIWSIDFRIDEAAFPIGFLAAAWAELKDADSPVVGMIGGMDIEPIQRYLTGYRSGVEYYNSKYSRQVQVIQTFLGTFDDFEYGYSIADSCIKQQSADVLLIAAGNAGNGALNAAKDNHKWATGTDVDQSISMPDLSDVLLTSCMKRLDTTIYSVTVSFLDEAISIPKIYEGTLENKGVSLAPFHSFDKEIPDSIKQAIEEIKTGIVAGTIDTGWQK